jgi:hypothetical protein
MQPQITINQMRTAALTHIYIAEIWLNLALAIDLLIREVVGYSLRISMTSDSAIDAGAMAKL